MGNCLKRSTADDVSLLRSANEPARESVVEQLAGEVPLYSVRNAFLYSIYYSLNGTFVFSQPVYYPSPSVGRPVNNLTEEEQIKLAKRIGLIQHLPVGRYAEHRSTGPAGSETKSALRECVICMLDFVAGDLVRCLPCMHTYHVGCIDDWLMRSLTCPSCLEPVDAALLTTYEAN